MSLILDTDHCIAILRGKLDISAQIEPTASLYVMAITVRELVYRSPEKFLPLTRTPFDGLRTGFDTAERAKPSFAAGCPLGV